MKVQFLNINYCKRCLFLNHNSTELCSEDSVLSPHIYRDMFSYLVMEYPVLSVFTVIHDI